ncbi:Sec7 domain-containing protein [Phyllosticta citrichinensis]|uniref:Sec7 domain-containing protein n=1 Tax=Phyllosticta citrichinensis TaxID=1130410 RepID=A0ABR1Y237_9PEZI
MTGTTSSDDRSSRSSPPRTPPMHAQRGPAAAGSSPSGTFFADETPTDKRRSTATDLSRLSRDSHDLKFRDVTRSSVVENMLFSLENLPSGSDTFPSSSSFDDQDYYRSTLARFSPPRILRTHGSENSFSVNYDAPEDYLSRLSRRDPRGNAPQNFRSALDRIDSAGSRAASTDAHRSRPLFGDDGYSHHVRGAGRKGSKGSSASSLDLGYSTPTGRPADRRLNLSPAFDQTFGDRSGFQQHHESIMERGRPDVMSLSGYDAAPTPTIPTGSRRHQGALTSSSSYDFSQGESAFSPPPPPPPPPAHTSATPGPVPRKNSLRSSSTKGQWNWKPRGGGEGGGGVGGAGPDENIRSQAKEFVNAVNSSSSNHELPRLPSLSAFVDSASNSRVGAPATQTPAQPKGQQRGFFSRVFGARKNNQQVQESPKTAGLPPQDQQQQRSPEPSNRRPSTTPANSLHASQHPHSSSNTHTKDDQRPPPVLNKKNSSFFRRRKRSVTEQTAAPPMPPPGQARTELPESVVPSASVTSLHQIMTPYLNDPRSDSPAASHYDSREHQRPLHDGVDKVPGFSPEYKPHRDATIRPVKPGSRGTDDSVPPASDDVRQSPKHKLKVKRSKGSRANDDSSFLADSSGAEDKTSSPSPAEKGLFMAVPEQQSRRPATSPVPPQLAPLPGQENARPKANGERRSDLQPSINITPHRTLQKEMEDEDSWVIMNPARQDASGSDVSDGKPRVWLHPDLSDEGYGEDVSDLALPFEGTRKQPDPDTLMMSDTYHPASNLPVLQIDGHETRPSIEARRPLTAIDEEPTDDDREKARQVFEGIETFVSKSRAAAWLGEKTAVSARCRKAYMELYEWSGFNILLAMRDLCSRLVLKGETQEVDRVLDAFALRWCECNPNHGFKSPGAVHTICYSLLLLNTDLHMADIESKMTRSQFIKNTLPTITSVVEAELSESNSNHDDHSRSNTPLDDFPSSPTGEYHGDRGSTELGTKRSKNRLSIKPTISHRPESDGYAYDSGSGDRCTALVKAPFDGPMKAWESQVEVVLKEFYNSIKTQRLPLHGDSSNPTNSSNSLSVSGVLRRTPSVLSKAPSDTTSYRGRTPDFRSTSRWNPKARSRPRIYPNSTLGSSRTSLEEASVWSPAPSSKWSSYSIGKTGTSMSVESLGSHFSPVDHNPSIGFANLLNQAMIREENHVPTSSEDFGRTAPLLEDETLELHGPPWAKEGMLKHKFHLESMQKRFKDRNWNEVFAVIEKGYMKLFTFNSHGKSTRNKGKRRPSAGDVVGGGNWLDNAEELQSFLLRQTLATILPPPGYSKQRPHVWALSLPTGAVHLFQANTADIVKEFVNTANYWAARLSKEPLVGGVSNLEYGWGEGVINPALIGINRPDTSPMSNNVGMPRPSLQSSIRSSIDHGSGTVKPRLPGDKVPISDWKPPTPSMMASNLMEVDQLKALAAYVKSVEEELSKHQELRAPMLIAFSPRHPNAGRAMTNFQKKSEYLLKELIKFKTYIEALHFAHETKTKIYKEREEREQEKAAAAEGPAEEGRDTMSAADSFTSAPEARQAIPDEAREILEAMGRDGESGA